ncbi:MAG TPA: M28 family peptidase, partial [Candidatus Sulfotelmatobacter sp.]|nr:M28 family peptidase [Candidatus Sulfotelmatobacter sp.]
MRKILSFCLLILFANICFGQQRHSVFMGLGRDIVQQKLSLQPATEDARLAAMRKLFSDAGCGGQRFREQTVPKAQVNMMCSTQGASDSIIVVAAPLEYKAKGDEATLRWGDLAMLPILAESLGAVLTRHQFVFVAFSGGHLGEDGAKAFIEQLPPEERKKVDAVVAFDRLGRFRPAYSVPGTGTGVDIRTGRYGGVAQFSRFNPNDYAITRSIQAAAQRFNFETPDKTNEFGSDLTRPFHSQGVPAITFTSPAWTIVRYIGDQPIRDFRSSLNPQVYHETYLFLSAYLLHLDIDIGHLPKGQTQEVADALLAASLSGMQSIQDLRSKTIQNLPPPPSLPAPSVAQPATVAASSRAPVPASVVDTPGTPVFRATTRLVQVDVVVTRKSGEPIEGLSREDFTILQDGRPQTANVFEAHTARDAAPESAETRLASQPHALNSYS